MRTILVIDDDRDSRELISLLLKPLEYRLIYAENGVAGIRMAMRHHPDLMTVDVRMPHMNGLNMMKILDLLKLKVPAIFVTVKPDIDKYIGMFPSVVDYCPKEKLKGELLGKVREILDQHHERSFSDITYRLEQKEIYGLLGKSDRKKILLVSSLVAREMVMTMFSESQLYEFYFAPDGQEAVFKAVMIKPHLIVCDLDLKDFDGMMLARILYILGHPFPLIFISDKSDKETITRASKLEGIRGFLLKSELKRDPDLIQERIKTILNISDADKERLKASYETVDVEKIEEITVESSIWASLTP